MVMAQSSRDSSNPPLAIIAVADPSFRPFLEYILRHIGLSVVADSDFTTLIQDLPERPPDLLLLESRLPGFDVPALCARLRLDKRTRGIAILVLGAKGDDELYQNSILSSGADEYVSRPFTPDKLIACIRGLLTDRSRAPAEGAPDLLTFVDIELDLPSYSVRRNGHIIRLAPTEFRLLHHLMKNPRKVHSREELQHAAWPRSVYLGPRTVDVHIGRLRAALNEHGGKDLIRTVRSVGYALSD